MHGLSGSILRSQPVLESEDGARALVHDVGEPPHELAGPAQPVHQLLRVEGGVPCSVRKRERDRERESELSSLGPETADK